MRADLIRFGGAGAWRPGQVHELPADASLAAIAAALDRACAEADAVLLWDAALGAPEPADVAALLERPGEAQHAGLALGTQGLPTLMDFAYPDWMLNADPPATIECSSWRITWRACLLRSEVWRQLGGLETTFASRDAAFLDLGLRWLRGGVFVRHQPTLAGGITHPGVGALPLEDELRFGRRHFGGFLFPWAISRALATATCTTAQLARVWPRVRTVQAVERRVFTRPATRPAEDLGHARVTVLIPTIERYPYLRPLLEQLRAQTHRPAEIVVIDQTPPAVRDVRLAQDFADLPIKLLVMDQPGQCRSRNAGLHASTGDFILFIDDDDEVQPTLIADHLAALARHRSDASCGVADEVDAGPLPDDFTFVRTSDVFPTNNTMIRRPLLARSGLFDMAYDRMPRADADLGMRAFLSGAHMVLDPAIRVLHHHAPRGGLRTHKARVMTYAASREKLTARHLPSPSEIYLTMRYHTPRRVREMLWQRAFGTLAGRGPRWRRGAKCLVGAAQLPDTMRAIHGAEARARDMLREFPQIDHIG